MIEHAPIIGIDYGPDQIMAKSLPDFRQQTLDLCGEPQNDIFCRFNEDGRIFAVEPRKGVKWNEEVLRRAILIKYPFNHIDEITLKNMADGHETLFAVAPGSLGSPEIILNADHPEDTIAIEDLTKILVDNAVHDSKFAVQEPVAALPTQTVPLAAIESSKIEKPTPQGMILLTLNVGIAYALALGTVWGFFAYLRRTNPDPMNLKR